MEPPIIRVEDCDDAAPALTLRYSCGENELDLKVIYADIYSLLDHPGRARFSLDLQKVILCSDAFLDAFWSAAASLLDYFADFYATDTALMQSIWFHLLDLWQRASPIHVYKGGFDYLHSTLARRYVEDYNTTLDLIHRLVTSKPRARSSHGESIIHCPSGAVEGLAGRYETGHFTSGLKPWQQFLSSSAPGFTSISAQENAAQPTAHEGSTTRYVPQPAIALIQTHTARARALAVKLAEKENCDVPEALAAFDATTLAVPSDTARSHTYPSLSHHGKTVSYRLVQGAPPVKRHEGFTDPSMMINEPDLVLLDEAVGTCKGREAYVPMTGPVGQAGVGFDVWGVTESEDVLGWESGARNDGKGVLADGHGEIFDEWHFEDEKF